MLAKSEMEEDVFLQKHSVLSIFLSWLAKMIYPSLLQKTQGCF